MKELIAMTRHRGMTPSEDDEWARLHRALLLVEREKTRIPGRRLLEKLAALHEAELSSIAEAGLASSHYWSGDLRQALFWARHAVAAYPMTTAAVWCASLLITLFRTLGMKREKFEVERERIRLMRRIAFQSGSPEDRIYVLHELLKELDSRDLTDDAREYTEELEELLAATASGFHPIPA